MTEPGKMKSIWYFVGLTLLVMGGIVFLTGLYLLLSQSEGRTILSRLHPDVWWGAVMLIAGAAFFFKNR
jgi:hypothetical protein